jgi:hypothetical protein
MIPEEHHDSQLTLPNFRKVIGLFFCTGVQVHTSPVSAMQLKPDEDL